MSTLSIPAFAVSDKSRAEGVGQVFIQSRTGGAAGTFDIRIAVHFNPGADEYPAGSITIKTDLSDSLKGIFNATTVELINSYGKHNPTIYITGQCKGDFAVGGAAAPPKGLRYWVMIADNRGQVQPQAPGGTPDVVGFAIHDRNGNRIAYGTGPLRTGNISVEPE